MAIQCDRCNASVKTAKQLFGLDLCNDCFTAVENFARTKINRSTASKLLHGLAKVGKAVADGSQSGSFKNPIGDR